jgi:cyclic pyranopterin phosphate synthase
MEALTGVTVALLTIYECARPLISGMELTDIHLAEKSGGKAEIL